MKRWWNGLTNRGRVLMAVGFTGALLVVGVPLNVAAFEASGGSRVSETTAPVAARAEAKASATPTPVVTTERVDVAEAVAFESVSVDDPTRDVGTSAVTAAGQDGTLVRSYEVTSTDGVETGRVLVGESVTVQPVQQVTSVGTRQPYVAPAPVAAPAAPAPAASGCDPNYSGACVPIASDVDCAGGSGNGPAYVAGPVSVVGSDIYDLDRDGDGIACDK